MADQVALALQTQLEQLTNAELASLVIELIEDDRVAVTLGEVIYRRLTQAAQPPTELLWYRPIRPAHPLRRSLRS